MSVTKNIAKYVRDIGINLSELSRKSGVTLYVSIYQLRGWQKRTRIESRWTYWYMCSLRINPMDFIDKDKWANRENS